MRLVGGVSAATLSRRLRAYMSQPALAGEKARVENHTGWDTPALRVVAHAVCDAMRVSRDRTVIIRYYRMGSSIGTAYLNARVLKVWLPRPPKGSRGSLDLGQLVDVLYHEIEHNLGVEHRDMLRVEHGGGPLIYSGGRWSAFLGLEIRHR